MKYFESANGDVMHHQCHVPEHDGLGWNLRDGTAPGRVCQVCRYSVTTEERPDLIDLREWDWIVINTSGGKDSQVMLELIVRLAIAQGVLGRIVAVHADLGRVEWDGVPELAELQARHHGVRFEIVKRPQGDLLDQIEKRGKFPSNTARYCTSDHKRGQVLRLHTQLANETRAKRGNKHRVRILNAMGFRWEESPARAKKEELEHDKRSTNTRREVWNWHPILALEVDEVWRRIRESGVPYHWAYDLGMPRLSCCFCIYASRPALMIAGIRNPVLLKEYADLERRIDHTLRKDQSLGEIQDAIAAGEQPGRVRTWGDQ